MAETLILDSEAVAALAWPRERGAIAQRARAILAIAHERSAVIRIPAAVLAEVCRGQRRDAAVARLLNNRGVRVEPLDSATARLAGALLERAGLGSECAIDAFVVATAVRCGTSVVATCDPADLGRLAAEYPQVRLLAL